MAILVSTLLILGCGNGERNQGFVRPDEPGFTGVARCALGEYRRVIKVHPERKEAHTMVGLIRADRGELEEAIDPLTDALLLDVFFVPALTTLGTVYQERKELMEATALYQLAWAQNPLAPGLEYAMGETYFQQGNRDSADAFLSRVLKREPGNEPARILMKELGGPDL
ncbi:MAG: tetratricopeptide repeat protein [bacterium]|nr:tetratricopeptide repeat protein [bacterium]